MSSYDDSFSSTGVPGHTGPYDAVIIGASFGGPQAVEEILRELPKEFPAPIAVCQHIARGFTEGWADRLNGVARLRVIETNRTKPFDAGLVYVAPAGFQTRFTRASNQVYVRSDPDFADSLYVPSIDYMMTSASRVFGTHTLAVLLGGLGSDGAAGMLAVRQAGGYTIAESAQTAASYSMPEAAVRAGAVIEQLPRRRIIKRILELAMKEGPEPPRRGAARE